MASRKTRRHKRRSFNISYGGMSATDGHLFEFIIAGRDHKFVPTGTFIGGVTIVVSSLQVEKPIAARYGWTNWVNGSLFSKEDLPASSFCTDNWNDNTDGPIDISFYQY